MHHNHQDRIISRFCLYNQALAKKHLCVKVLQANKFIILVFYYDNVIWVLKRSWGSFEVES